MTEGGRKNDSGKPPLSLISYRAQIEEAKVLAFGRDKYDAWNWSNGIRWSRVVDAVLRHIGAYCDGEVLDPESGLSHLAHARCGLGFLLDFEKSHPELNDLRPRQKEALPTQMSLFPERDKNEKVPASCDVALPDISGVSPSPKEIRYHQNSYDRRTSSK